MNTLILSVFAMFFAISSSALAQQNLISPKAPGARVKTYQIVENKNINPYVNIGEVSRCGKYFFKVDAENRQILGIIYGSTRNPGIIFTPMGNFSSQVKIVAGLAVPKITLLYTGSSISRFVLEMNLTDFMGLTCLGKEA